MIEWMMPRGIRGRFLGIFASPPPDPGDKSWWTPVKRFVCFIASPGGIHSIAWLPYASPASSTVGGRKMELAVHSLEVISSLSNRTYPCACDSEGRACEVVYGPNTAEHRICVCSSDGEFCELCQGDVNGCIQTWGTLETARPCVCHGYSQE